MNKNKIKKIASYAREDIIKRVTLSALEIGVSKNNLMGLSEKNLNDKQNEQKKELIKRIEKLDFEEVIEEISYTWFNRFIALYFMEINNYLPAPFSSITKILSLNNGKPEILSNSFEIGLEIDKEYILDLINKNDEEATFKYVIIKIFNELNKSLPFLFEEIDNYMEILFPKNILNENSFLFSVLEEIESEDWKSVEIIGWFYQYYISDKKRAVFDNIKKGKKVDKKDIPAATQLFTPKWIVKYMVENTLGKIYSEIDDVEDLKKEWKYYFYDIHNEKKHFSIIPEDLKFLDPACGSGHILVYAFDLFYDYYIHRGYSKSEIPYYILEKNLYGLDIDERAVQLSKFALCMKSVEKYNRFFNKKFDLNIYSVEDTKTSDYKNHEFFYLKYFEKSELEVIQYLFDNFINAKEIGSLIKIKNYDYKNLLLRTKEIIENMEDLLFKNEEKESLLFLEKLLKIAITFSGKYNIVCSNPPYMGKKNINNNLRDFLNEKYPEVKADLFSAFIDRNFEFAEKDGYLGFMTPFVWMFNSRYKKLREKIINEKTILGITQLEYSSFSDAIVPICTFVLKNSFTEEEGTFIKLSDFKGYEIQNEKTLEAIKNKKVDYLYKTKSKYFKDLPDHMIAYWLNDRIKKIFSEEKKFSYFADSRQGLATGDNKTFLKYWYEVEYDKIGRGYYNIREFHDSGKFFAPYNKGGKFKKWYGNNELVIRFDKQNYDILSNQGNKLPSKNYYFKESITWGTLTVGTFNARYTEMGYVFDTKGSSCFVKEKSMLFYTLALLNSNLGAEFLKALSPSVDFNAGSIAKIPYKIPKDNFILERINDLVKANIEIVKNDWDYFETSPEFETSRFLTYKNDSKKMSDIFEKIKTENKTVRVELKQNEEEINQIINKIYELEEKDNYLVIDKNLSIKKVNKKSEIKNFISFFVGCVFGRYSPDKNGVIYAHSKEWKLNLYNDFDYKPLQSNILAILENECFDNDVVVKFFDFVKYVFGEKNFEENISFISKELDEKETNYNKVIRNYFKKYFFADHKKTYNKKPIYWILTSEKGYFKALIYFHRYQKDLITILRKDFVLTYQDKVEKLYQIALKSGTKKEIEKYENIIEDLKNFEEKLNHFSDIKITIDINEGVEKNSILFQDIIEK
jgi:hypothetical protein